MLKKITLCFKNIKILLKKLFNLFAQIFYNQFQKFLHNK